MQPEASDLGSLTNAQVLLQFVVCALCILIHYGLCTKLLACAADPVDPEMEPDTAHKDAQEAGQEQEEEDDADPIMLAKKQKQLAKRGVTFEAKVDPKVSSFDLLLCVCGEDLHLLCLAQIIVSQPAMSDPDAHIVLMCTLSLQMKLVLKWVPACILTAYAAE